MGQAHAHGDPRHDHHHGRGAHGEADRLGRAFAIGVALNTGFVAAEAAAGVWTGSLALLADAGHNLSDVLSLLLAWGAVVLARRAPAGRRTYGLRKGTILASLANAILLLVAVGAIASEGLRRLVDPGEVSPAPVMITAALGVAVNTCSALLFLKGRHGDLNQRGAFLHMAADAAVSLAVVAGGAIIWRTGWLWVDPALSLVIAVVIVLGAWGLLRDSTDLAMDAAPRGLDVGAVKAWLAGLPGVSEVHDLHVWAISTTETALTAHLVRAAAAPPDSFLQEASEGLSHRFGIGHVTLQLETGAAGACRLAPAEVV